MLYKQPASSASYNFIFLAVLTFFSWPGTPPEAFLLIWLLTSSCRLLKNAVDDRTDFVLAFSSTCMRQQDNVWFQASATKYIRCALLGTMQHIVVIPYQHSGTTGRSHLHRSRSWPLKMGLKSCPKTAVRNYCYTLCNIPKQCDKTT
jgi:hypothetical protein